jgi:hypothetical protein
MGFGGSKNEDDVGWRFLQSFQEGIESLVRQHVNFIDDVNLEFILGGKIPDILAKLSDLIDSPVRGSVNFYHIHRNSRANFLAERAVITRVGGWPFLAIEGFGQNPGHRSFSHSPRAGKKISVGYPLLGNGVLQRLRNGFLPDDFLKGLRPPFSGQD